MDFLELATKARTCRRFREESLPAGTLDWMVSCARVAPCGGNAQALRFAVAESPEACAAVFPALKWAAMLADWDGPEAGERPSGYIVIMGETGARGRLNAIDMGIASLPPPPAALAAAFFFPLIRASSVRPSASRRNLSPCSSWPWGWKRKCAAWKARIRTAPSTTGGTPRACTTCRSALLRSF